MSKNPKDNRFFELIRFTAFPAKGAIKNMSKDVGVTKKEKVPKNGLKK